MNGKINKLSNQYADVIPSDVYESTPKAVWAAIAVSLATCGGDRLDDAARSVIREWSILHENGIVPQDIPAALRKYNRPEDEDPTDYIPVAACTANNI